MIQITAKLEGALVRVLNTLQNLHFHPDILNIEFKFQLHNFKTIFLLLYRGADKSLALLTSRCILFDDENISFDVVSLHI